MTKGVLIASDAAQEWLLPWWWELYTAENSKPVTFVDLGLSEEKRQWCKARGEVVSLSVPEVSCVVDPTLAQEWEKSYGQGVGHVRKSWFKKPHALLLSPYEHTLFLDLDCEILRCLDPLFELPDEISLVREYGWDGIAADKHEVIYNSGVIVYKKDAGLLLRWAEKTLTESHRFIGDQELLSHLIYQEKWKVHELSYCYNWRIAQGINLDARVIHWAGLWGKNYIRQYGGLKEELIRARHYF